MHDDRTPDRDDEDPPLPCAQVLLGGTLALMSAHAEHLEHGAGSAGGEARTRLLARKIASNLFFLREHPALGPGLRGVVANAHAHWAARATRGSAHAGGVSGGQSLLQRACGAPSADPAPGVAGQAEVRARVLH